LAISVRIRPLQWFHLNTNRYFNSHQYLIINIPNRDIMIFKIFPPKNWQKIAFLPQNTAILVHRW
jgi:hypothetical protein